MRFGHNLRRQPSGTPNPRRGSGGLRQALAQGFVVAGKSRNATCELGETRIAMPDLAGIMVGNQAFVARERLLVRVRQNGTQCAA